MFASSSGVGGARRLRALRATRRASALLVGRARLGAATATPSAGAVLSMLPARFALRRQVPSASRGPGPVYCAPLAAFSVRRPGRPIGAIHL